MDKISLDGLCSLDICDALVEKVECGEDLVVTFSGASVEKITFCKGKICEIRICGYEVYDEHEEPLFDMPDVEIIGDAIPEALKSLIESRPNAVEFETADTHALLTVTDDTETYEIEIEFEEAYI